MAQVAVATSNRAPLKQVYIVKPTKGHDTFSKLEADLKHFLEKEFDSDAARLVIPRGFGGGWDESKSAHYWKYGATRHCHLGLCLNMFSGKGCKTKDCECKHSWFTNEQIAYLLSRPEVKAREAAAGFLRSSLSSWHSSWRKMGMRDFDDPEPPRGAREGNYLGSSARGAEERPRGAGKPADTRKELKMGTKPVSLEQLANQQGLRQSRHAADNADPKSEKGSDAQDPLDFLQGRLNEMRKGKARYDAAMADPTEGGKWQQETFQQAIKEDDAKYVATGLEQSTKVKILLAAGTPPYMINEVQKVRGEPGDAKASDKEATVSDKGKEKAVDKEATVLDEAKGKAVAPSKGKEKASNEDDRSSASQPPPAEDGAAVAKPDDRGGVKVPTSEA